MSNHVTQYDDINRTCSVTQYDVDVTHYVIHTAASASRNITEYEISVIDRVTHYDISVMQCHTMWHQSHMLCHTVWRRCHTLCSTQSMTSVSRNVTQYDISVTRCITLEQEDIHRDNEVGCMGAHPIHGALRQQRLNPIKLAYDQHWQDGQLN